MLRSWLRTGARSDLASAVGVTPETISLIKSGRRRPSFELALKISAATNGAVSVESLMRGPRNEWPMGARIFEGDPVPDTATQDARRRATDRRTVLEVLEREFDFTAASAVQCLADAAQAGEDPFVWADRNDRQYRRTGCWVDAAPRGAVAATTDADAPQGAFIHTGRARRDRNGRPAPRGRGT